MIEAHCPNDEDMIIFEIFGTGWLVDRQPMGQSSVDALE